MKLNTEKCLKWAEERGLLGENPKTDKQLEKLSSEANEMNDELNKRDLEKAFMEFGDVLVTMIIYCAQSHINFDAVTANQTENKRNGLDLIAAIGDAARLENTIVLDNETEEGVIAITQMADILGEIYDICCNLAFYFNPQKALDAAVEKISNRKTFMKNGTVVKEEDFTDKERKQLGNMS
jgi:phosphoribosyl-ATP pyrophosphohydrolase